MGWIDSFRNRITGARSSLRPFARAGTLNEGQRDSQRTFNTQAQHPGITYGITKDAAEMQELETFAETHWLARRVIETLVRLTLSEIKTNSEDEDLDLRVRIKLRELGIMGILEKMLRHFFTWGDAYAEIVVAPNWDEPTDVTRLFVPESPSMRVDLQPWGSPRRFVQLPQFLSAFYGSAQPIELEPSSILFLSRNQLGDQIYGASVLKPILKELNSSSYLESAMVKAGIHSVTGKRHHHYQAAEGENQDEIEEAVNQRVDAYNNSEPGAPTFSGGAGEWKNEDAANYPVPMTKELEQVITMAIAGSGLTPAAVGVPFGQSMHEAGEQRVFLMGAIKSIQSQIVEQLNSKVMRVLSDIWNVPGEIYLEMAEPILMNEKEREELTTIRINNAGIQEKMGFLTGPQAAQYLGYDDLADEDQNQTWLEGGMTLEEQRNPNDPNETQQDTKNISQNSRGEEPNNE